VSEPSEADQTCELLKWLCNYRKLHNTTTSEQFRAIFPLAPDQTIAQMWSNGVWGDSILTYASSCGVATAVNCYKRYQHHYYECATTESYTIKLLENSYGNIPSCSWPNHSSVHPYRQPYHITQPLHCISITVHVNTHFGTTQIRSQHNWSHGSRFFQKQTKVWILMPDLQCKCTWKSGVYSN